LEDARGNYKDALDWFRKAARRRPSIADSWIYCGHIASKQGRLALWERYERRALQCSEGALDEAWHNLGGALLAQERLEEARDCYIKAIAIDPKYTSAKKRLKDVEQALQLRSKEASKKDGV